jgi:hypothetical protein
MGRWITIDGKQRGAVSGLHAAQRESLGVRLAKDGRQRNGVGWVTC